MNQEWEWDSCALVRMGSLENDARLTSMNAALSLARTMQPVWMELVRSSACALLDLKETFVKQILMTV